MGITVNTSPQQITASVGETKIDVSVSGGIGPTGPAGEVGGGYSLPIATAGTLGGVRIGSGISIDPATGVISASSGYTLPTATANVLGGVKIGSGVTITDGVISVSTNYAAASHTHDFTEVTDDNVYVNFSPEGGSLATALSGIDSAISGKAAASHTHEPADVVSASGVNFPELLSWGSGETLVDFLASVDYSISQRAALSHAHGAITSDGKVGATAGLVLKTGTAGAVEALAQGTAGQVLKVNSGATGVEWGAAAADVSIDTTAADILSATSGAISADDPGADRLVFWDDSASKLTHLEVGTGLAISGTTLAASTASTSAAGIAQLATAAESRTATSESRAMTPVGVLRGQQALNRLDGGIHVATTASGGSVTTTLHAVILTSGTTSNGSALVRWGASNEPVWQQGGTGTQPASRIDWSQPRSIWMRTGSFNAFTANGVFRAQWGKTYTTTTLGRMDIAGIGIEIQNRRVYLLAHNGTSVTAVDSGFDIPSADLTSTDYWITSDGTGTVRLFINGTEQCSTTSGPSAASSGIGALTAEITNGGDAAMHRLYFHRYPIIHMP